MTIRRKLLTSRRPKLRDLPIGTLLDLIVGWRPPVFDVDRARSPWTTWAEFFLGYEAIRAEFLAHPWVQDQCDPPAFAETEYQRWIAAGRPTAWEAP